MTHAIEIHQDAPPDGWDRIVASLGGGIFHSHAWARYQVDLSATRALYLLCRDASGEPAGVAVTLVHESRTPVLSRFLRDLTFTAHPLTRAHAIEPATALMEEGERLGRRLGCARLWLGSFGSGRSPILPASRGFLETERIEFVADLTTGVDAVWQAIDKKQRERIRQLERKAVAVTVETGRDALTALQSLRGSTQRKRAARGQGYSLAAGERLDDAIERHLLRGDLARIFTARVEGQPVAAILYATFAGRAYSMFSGSSSEGYRLGAQSLLYWAAVQRFHGEGFVELNRGGGPGAAESPEHPLHGIYQFKLRLGTTPLRCRSGVKVLSPLRAALADMKNRLAGHAGGDAAEED